MTSEDIGMISNAIKHMGGFAARQLIKIYIPSDSFWPGEDHQVELAVTIINEVTSIATFFEHGVLGPVFGVGGIVGHQLLNSLDIDTFAIESIGTEFLVKEADKLIKVLGNRDAFAVGDSSRGGIKVLGHDRRDGGQGH
jgi:hypothetical protein